LNIRTINRIVAGRGRRSTRSNAARALRKLFYGAGSIGSAQKKPLLLMYRGRDLHKAAVLEEFGHEYTNLYLKLFLKRDE